jgi:hypothetical protein
MITERVESTVGFQRVNALVLDRLREWFVESGEKALDDVKKQGRGGGQDEAVLLKNVAWVLRELGNFSEARLLPNRTLPIGLKVFGENSVASTTLPIDLAEVLRSLSEYDEALLM